MKTHFIFFNSKFSLLNHFKKYINPVYNSFTTLLLKYENSRIISSRFKYLIIYWLQIKYK